jgi:cytochrome c553
MRKPTTTTVVAAVFASLAFAAGSAVAQTPPQIPNGRLLASNCFQCHGTNGKGPGFEKLAGESANEIYKELVEMRSGKEGSLDKDIMVRHAMGYTDAQLRAIADYLSKQR